MNKAGLYRRYASECLRLAQQSQSPPEKQTLLDMAEMWRKLAQHAETTSENDVE